MMQKYFRSIFLVTFAVDLNRERLSLVFDCTMHYTVRLFVVVAITNRRRKKEKDNIDVVHNNNNIMHSIYSTILIPTKNLLCDLL